MSAPLTKDELYDSMEKAKWDLVKWFTGMIALQGVVIVGMMIFVLKVLLP